MFTLNEYYSSGLLRFVLLFSLSLSNRYTSDSIRLICKLAPNPAINDNTAYFYLIENAVPTKHVNPDFYEDIEVVLYSKKDFIELLQQNKMMHGVQLGPIYEALIQLGWLQYS